MKKTNKLKICLATAPLGKSGITPLQNMIKILSQVSMKLVVLTNVKITLTHIDNCLVYYLQTKTASNSKFSALINFLTQQVELIIKLLSVVKDVDVYIFFIGLESALIPMFLLRILCKKVIVILVGDPLKIAEMKKTPFTNFIIKLRKIKSNFTLLFSSHILLYSKNIIKERNLTKYTSKISIAHGHLIDFSNFNVTKCLDERRNLIGFIGRFSEEKGIINLVRAIPKILSNRKDITFMLIGEGELSDKINFLIKEYGVEEKVLVYNWVPHQELPKYLNEFKLLVVPSYSEGLPNVIIEAMACGTPVLATSVGAIPEIIKNGITGFILKDNSENCISENILKIIEDHTLKNVSVNAYIFIKNIFSFEKILPIYNDIMIQL